MVCFLTLADVTICWASAYVCSIMVQPLCHPVVQCREERNHLNCFSFGCEWVGQPGDRNDYARLRFGLCCILKDFVFYRGPFRLQRCHRSPVDGAPSTIERKSVGTCTADAIPRQARQIHQKARHWRLVRKNTNYEDAGDADDNLTNGRARFVVGLVTSIRSTQNPLPRGRLF